jgi:hypothetical protein
MSRASRCEIEQRIDEVYDLLLSRVSYRAILGYAARKWGVSARQTRTYLARARVRLAEASAESRPEKLAKAAADYDLLFAKQLAAGRLAEARQTLDSIVKLLGLAAPDKLEIYDFSSYSDKQLAEEISRELPELIHEAERLTRRTAAPDQGEKPDAGTLDPPHPDA